MGGLFYLIPICSGGAWKYLPGIKGENEDPGNWREESELGPGKLQDQRPSWFLSRLFQGKVSKAIVREPHCWIKWSTKWAMGMWPSWNFPDGQNLPCLFLHPLGSHESHPTWSTNPSRSGRIDGFPPTLSWIGDHILNLWASHYRLHSDILPGVKPDRHGSRCDETPACHWWTWLPANLIARASASPASSFFQLHFQRSTPRVIASVSPGTSQLMNACRSSHLSSGEELCGWFRNSIEFGQPCHKPGLTPTGKLGIYK